MDRPAGRYQVIWRATSVDGHVVSGAFDFSAAAAAAAAAAAPGSVTGSTSGPDSGAGSTSGTGTVTGAVTGTGKAQWMLAALAAAGLGIAVLGSRRRTARQRAEL